MSDVNAAEPVVLVAMRVEARVGRHRLPQAFQTLEIVFEILGGIRITQAPQSGEQAFACIGNRNTLEKLHASRNFPGHGRAQCFPINERLLTDGLIEVQRFLKVSEDAEIIDHQTCALIH
jgi:hypothetical protein